MASTTFVDGTTPVVASWLNDVNTSTYTTVPAHTTTLASGVVLKDSTTGAAAMPAGTTAQRPASLSLGQFRYNTTLSKWEGYNGSAWGSIGGGATGGGGDAVFVETNQTITADYTLTSGFNAMSAGPVTIANGVTVTIPTGATWTVV